MRSVVCLLLAALSVSTTFAADAPPGVVIDHSPARSKSFIGSPSIAVVPTVFLACLASYIDPDTCDPVTNPGGDPWPGSQHPAHRSPPS